MLQQLTTEPGLYQSLNYDIKGDRIVFVRSNARVYKEAYGPVYDGNEDELGWINPAGGEVDMIDKSLGRFNPHFVKNQEDKIYLNNGEGYLLTIKWDGTDEKKLYM